MAFDKSVKQKAYALYMAGVPNVRIAECTGFSERGLYHVIERENWKERRVEHEALMKELGKKDRSLIEEKLLDSIEQVWARLVNEHKASASARDVIEALKYRRLKEGLSTENVAVAGKVGLTLEEEYAQHLKERELEKSAVKVDFLPSVLPIVKKEKEEKEAKN